MHIMPDNIGLFDAALPSLYKLKTPKQTLSGDKLNEKYIFLLFERCDSVVRHD